MANAASASVAGNVQMYPPGSTAPTLTYASGITDPVALAVDGRSVLYVANRTGAAPAPLVIGPTIVEFAAGSISPAATVSDPNAASVAALAVDRGRNLYLAYDSYLCCPVPAIDELVPNPPQPTVLAIAEASEGSQPAPFLGIALDAAGNLLASDGVRIEEFAPSTLTWPSVSAPATFGTRGAPTALAFSASRSKLFVVDHTGNEVIGYAYPSGTVVNLVSKSIETPVALAVGPAGRPPARTPQPPRPKKPASLGAGTLYRTDNYVTLGVDARTFAQKRRLTQKSYTPVALAADAKDDLDVANLGPTPNISIYGPHGSTPLTQLDVTIAAEHPFEAVAPDGTIALSQDNPSRVAVFFAGSQTPVELTLSNVCTGVTFDADSNLYVAFSGGSAWLVDEYARGSGGFGAPVQVFSAPLIDGLAIDPAGNLVFGVNDGYDVYGPGQKTPTYEIGNGLANSMFTLADRGAFLYGMAYNSEGSNGVWVFRYPTGTPYAFFAINHALADSLAITPAVPPGPPWTPSGERR